MTPQERQLIDELFDRLASLESEPRDPDAVRAINDGLRRAPNALYPLVQTTLVQDEALKRADARIRELEAELGIDPAQPARPAGFLDQMRDALTGRREAQGSVPTVRPAAAPRTVSPWSRAAAQPAGSAPAASPGYAPPQAPGSSGGSFLGTAAAATAGVVGGALLMNSVRGMFGGQQQGTPSRAFDSPGGAGTPWSSNSGGDLARDAGVNDIGRGDKTAARDDSGGSQRAGWSDTGRSEAEDTDFGDNTVADNGSESSGGDGEA